jgi:hypothetical protein
VWWSEVNLSLLAAIEITANPGVTDGKRMIHDGCNGHGPFERSPIGEPKEFSWFHRWLKPDAPLSGLELKKFGMLFDGTCELMPEVIEVMINVWPLPLEVNGGRVDDVCGQSVGELVVHPMDELRFALVITDDVIGDSEGNVSTAIVV